MTRVLLGLGSNLEPREEHIRTALDLLQERGAVRVERVSRLRETEPVGGPPQGSYLNGAALVETDLSPRDLLALIKSVEGRVGRSATGVRWGPREVDVDILLHGDLVVQEPGLIVPHPRLTGRRFVLEPAAEIAGDFLHPVLALSIAELLRRLPERLGRGAPRLLSTPEDLRGWVKTSLRNRFTTGLVPTMGALHEGHASLMRAAYRETDRVVASIFVNPRQFDDPSDLDRYPRTLEEDIALCAENGVDAVFAPSAEDMYPKGFCTRVEVEGISRVLEGAIRPGHFSGVATVVLKLIALALPDRAYFGQKDFQQACLVRRMVKDLGAPCTVVVMPTVRDLDGLAVSSRNRFLSPEDRRKGLALPRALEAARRAWADGERNAGRLHAEAAGVLGKEPGFAVDYLVVADPETLETLQGDADRAVILAAGRAGSVRLLDNVLLE
ncbi:MAG: pantoate--beta-alanine ligase [Planctomycetes bacterium]|nr:pantoate--beta-alanine ligase [Planctomycetota bacterium]